MTSPNNHNGNDEFDAVINANYVPGPAYIDPHPYGPNPAHTAPAKTGLTRRGKTALAIGGTILATSGLMFWQHNEAVTAASQARAEELAIKRQQVELEKLKELREQSALTVKQQTAASTARQKLIDACVKDNKGLVGKQLGATLSSVIEDCQTQYPDTATGSDMQAAASSEDTSSSGGNNVGTGALVAGGFLLTGIVIATRKATRGNREPAPVRTYY